MLGVKFWPNIIAREKTVVKENTIPVRIDNINSTIYYCVLFRLPGQFN